MRHTLLCEAVDVYVNMLFYTDLFEMKNYSLFFISFVFPRDRVIGLMSNRTHLFVLRLPSSLK